MKSFYFEERKKKKHLTGNISCQPNTSGNFTVKKRRMSSCGFNFKTTRENREHLSDSGL